MLFFGFHTSDISLWKIIIFLSDEQVDIEWTNENFPSEHGTSHSMFDHSLMSYGKVCVLALLSVIEVVYQKELQNIYGGHIPNRNEEKN